MGGDDYPVHRHLFCDTLPDAFPILEEADAVDNTDAVPVLEKVQDPINNLFHQLSS